MKRSYRHILLGVAVTAIVGAIVVRIVSRGDAQGPICATNEPQRRGQAEQSPLREQQRSRPPAGVDEGRSIPPGSLNRDTSAHEWQSRFHRSSDFWEFVNEAAPDAAAGDARAQFLLAEALGECHTSVALKRTLDPDVTMSPEQIFEVSFWKNASPSLPSHYVEFSRRKFMKCAKFFSGDPPALDDLQIGSEAHSREYWMTLALEHNDPVARMQEAYMLTADLGSIEAESRVAAIDRIREALAVAAQSADPEAVFRIGVLAAYTGLSDPAEAPAWTLAACELGYDCTYANPAVGLGCVELGMCTGAESIVLNTQQGLGSSFGMAYARSQDIVYAIENGSSNRVVEELFDKLALKP